LVKSELIAENDPSSTENDNQFAHYVCGFFMECFLCQCDPRIISSFPLHLNGFPSIWLQNVRECVCVCVAADTQSRT